MGRSPPVPAPLRAVAALLAMLLVLGPGGRALAAPARSTLVVLPEVPLPGTSDVFAARVSAQVLNELRQRAEIKLATAPAADAREGSPEKAQAEAAKARESATLLFNKAGELSQKGKARQAAQALQKAAAQLSAQPLALDEAGGKLLGDVLVQLAVARAMAGDEDGSDAALAELVRRAPERTLAAGSFPPAFLRSFDSVRQRQLGNARASIRVFAPAGAAVARVLLDGRPLGNAPLLLSDALPGEHAVRVESGEESWAESVKADPGATLSLQPRFGATGDDGLALAQGRIDRPAALRLARLAKAAGAQAALVSTVSREGDGYAVRSALVFARGERVVPLAPLALDTEMLSASLEVLRLADDLVAKLAAPPASASLPLAMGGAALDAGGMPSVAAAPPAPDTALALPAATDLAVAAGTAKKLELPLPDATEPAPSAPAPLAAEPERAPVLPGASAPDRTPAVPSPDRAPVVPAAPPAIADVPPTPAPDRAPTVPATQAAIADVPPAATAAPAPAAQASPATPPAPLSGSLDAAVAALNASPAPAPASAAAPAPPTTSAPATAAAPAPAENPASAGDRHVFVPGSQAPPLPSAPAQTVSDTSISTPEGSAPLAAAAPKQAEAPAPSRDLVVPRRATQRDDDEPIAVVEPATTPAPLVATQIEAREANEIATVREPSKSHAALWIVAGALVLGAAAVGGAVVYANSRTASSSNVALSWSHP